MSDEDKRLCGTRSLLMTRPPGTHCGSLGGRRTLPRHRCTSAYSLVLEASGPLGAVGVEPYVFGHGWPPGHLAHPAQMVIRGRDHCGPGAGVHSLRTPLVNHAVPLNRTGRDSTHNRSLSRSATVIFRSPILWIKCCWMPSLPGRSAPIFRHSLAAWPPRMALDDAEPPPASPGWLPESTRAGVINRTLRAGNLRAPSTSRCSGTPPRRGAAERGGMLPCRFRCNPACDRTAAVQAAG